MMQNSAEHAQLWPHSFIILTQGPASTLHEEDRGQKWKTKQNKKQKKMSADSRPQSWKSFNTYVHSLYKYDLAANQV